MRLCHVTSYPPELLRTHYRRTPELADAPYHTQHRRLMDLLYGWSDFIPQHLTALGHEGLVLIFNHTRAQEQWAREKGLPSASRDEILLAQIKDSRADVLFLEDCFSISPELVRAIRSETPSIHLVVGYIGVISRVPDLVHNLDLVVTCAEPLSAPFAALGCRTVTVRHGFETSVLEKLSPLPERLDVSFVGSLHAGLHSERLAILEQVAKTCPLTIYSDSLRPQMATAVRNLAAAVVRQRLGAHFKLVTSPLSRTARPAVHGVEMYSILSSSDVALNCQGGAVGFLGGNMRLFEITGCGSCMVTDTKPGLSDLFEPDTEIVGYESKEECAEKTKWLLAHPRHRAAIAAAGQKRTLKDHTFASRVGELVGHIDRLL